jgi:RimJ/RimL family protein N-acetyltransferase
MSAQPQAPVDVSSNNASRVIAMVSPHDDRIAIGPVLPEDIVNLFLWLNDVDAARTDFSYRPVDGIALKQWLDSQSPAGQVLFVVRTLAASRAIGFVHIKNLSPIHRSAELGVRIGMESDRGKGYGCRAVALALSYAWNSLNLHRVHLTVFADNRRAITAYRRAGFCEEGLLRQAAYIDGRWLDVLVMGTINPREA